MAFDFNQWASGQVDRQFGQNQTYTPSSSQFASLGNSAGFSGAFGRNTNFGALTTRLREMRDQQGGGGVGGAIGGIGGFSTPRVNLDGARSKEIGAMERMIRLQFEGVKTELEGTLAQTELDRDFSLAQQERGLRTDTRHTRGEAMGRGILDSGIFLENMAEVQGAAQESMAHTRNSAAAMIGGLQSQMALLDAQRSAQIAFERAQIERAYMMARISGF